MEHMQIMRKCECCQRKSTTAPLCTHAAAIHLKISINSRLCCVYHPLLLLVPSTFCRKVSLMGCFPLIAPDISSLGQLRDGEMKTDLEASLPSGQEDYAIRCRDVCRSYGKLKVLNNLNLSVPQGQM